MRVTIPDQDLVLFDGPAFSPPKDVQTGVTLRLFAPLPPPTAPGSFGTGQWSVVTGSNSREVALTINALPSDGDTPITALQYNSGAGWVTMPGTGTGTRVLTMPSGDTEYTFTIRAMNVIGAGVGSATKTARSAISVYDADALALFARFDIEPTEDRKHLISDRFVAAKATTWWAKLDALWVHAAHGAEAGRLNWKGPNFNCLPVNSPGFIVDRGYTGDGTSSYLDTQFNPATQPGAQYQQDSASFGIRANTDDTGSGSIAGFYDGSKGTTIQNRSTDSRSGFRVNTPSYTQTGAGATPSAIGMFSVSRTAANVSRMYRNGALIASSTAASQAPASGSLRLGGISVESLRASQFSMGFIGGGLSDAEVASIYDWFEPYRAALGIN